MERKDDPDRPWIVDWEMCCNPETCLGEDFIGAQGWSFSVALNDYFANQMHLAYSYIYIRPQGSGQPFALMGQNQNNSNPAFFDLGMALEPGCYDVVIANYSANNPHDFRPPSAVPHFTFCCGGLIE